MWNLFCFPGPIFSSPANSSPAFSGPAFSPLHFWSCILRSVPHFQRQFILCLLIGHWSWAAAECWSVHFRSSQTTDCIKSSTGTRKGKAVAHILVFSLSMQSSFEVNGAFTCSCYIANCEFIIWLTNTGDHGSSAMNILLHQLLPMRCCIHLYNVRDVSKNLLLKTRVGNKRSNFVLKDIQGPRPKTMSLPVSNSIDKKIE